MSPTTPLREWGGKAAPSCEGCAAEQWDRLGGWLRCERAAECGSCAVGSAWDAFCVCSVSVCVLCRVAVYVFVHRIAVQGWGQAGGRHSGSDFLSDLPCCMYLPVSGRLNEEDVYSYVYYE